MKKTIAFLLINILILGSLVGVASKEKNFFEKEKVTQKTESLNILFSNIEINQHDSNYLEVNLKDTSTYHMTPGRPMLPKVVKTIYLPFGVKNVNVEVITKNIITQEITSEVKPSPISLPLNADANNIKTEEIKDMSIYQSSDPYPNEISSYSARGGLDKNLNHATVLNIEVYPVQYIPLNNELLIAQDADIKVTYDLPNSNPFTKNSEYDLVVIAPNKFKRHLKDLVDHKNNFGVKTTLVTTENIYKDYNGFDKPEKIKYFIKDAIETMGIKYVLLVGGLKSTLWAKPRDDHNQGSKMWYLPVRYNNLYDDPDHPLSSSIHDPGVITDLYYADIYDDEGKFSSWDTNGDGIYAAWKMEGVDNDTGIDMMPDVMVGRLACRSVTEVKNVVEKIIKYENQPADPSWFKRCLSISGDGFLDQQDLDFQWDTNSLQEGVYKIKAQSSFVDEFDDRIYSEIDEVTVTIDRSAETNISVDQSDHEKVPGYPGPYEYPAPPIAEIVNVANGDIIGDNDFYYEPTEGEAYCNGFNGWANVEYENKILHIRGKSYNPRPYGVYTDVHLWIENENNDLVFDDWRNDTAMYYEGEWVVGNRELKGGGGAFYYMDDFEIKYLWASNGLLRNKHDLIPEFSKGYGFVFMSGHGSPNQWGDHFPGVPGNREHASFTALTVSSLKLWEPYYKIPMFPMSMLDNKGKPSIVLVGGCHNSQFNVSIIEGFLDLLPYVFPNMPERYMWCHGFGVPECFSWYMITLEDRGAIATMGNTGLGYGILGEDCLIGGLDGGICIEFFKQYGENGYHVLGDAYTQTLISYINTFDMLEDDHVKTLHQWVLLGDPTLMIGGYP